MHIVLTITKDKIDIILWLQYETPSFEFDSKEKELWSSMGTGMNKVSDRSTLLPNFDPKQWIHKDTTNETTLDF